MRAAQNKEDLVYVGAALVSDPQPIGSRHAGKANVGLAYRHRSPRLVSVADRIPREGSQPSVWTVTRWVAM